MRWWGSTATGSSPACWRAARGAGGPLARARTCATSSARISKGFEAVIHLAGLSNDPLGNLDSSLTYEINDAASIRFARLAKEAGVERFLFSSSCSTYGAAGDDFLDENGRVQSRHPLRRLQGAARAAARGAGGRPLQPHLSAQRHRLRRLPPPAGGPGAQQPGGLRGDHRAHPPHERRHPLAADRPYRGHQPRLPRRAGRPARADPRPGVQRRPHGGELPHPRAGGDRGRDGARLRRSPTPRTPARTSAATAWTATRSSGSSPPSSPSGTPAGAPASSTTPTARRASPPEEFLGSRFIRLKRIQELQSEGRLDEALRWQAPVPLISRKQRTPAPAPPRSPCGW